MIQRPESLAYEALAGFPDYLIIVPESRESVAAAVDAAAWARRCVLWLDDLENYLGTGGLTRAALARLLAGRRCHRVVIATLRAAEESVLLGDSGGGDDIAGPGREAMKVLELAYRVPLQRLFSRSEQDRARAVGWDPASLDWEVTLLDFLAPAPETSSPPAAPSASGCSAPNTPAP